MAEGKRLAYRQHLEECGRCASLVAEWRAILGENEARPVPHPRVKRRLLRRYRLMAALAFAARRFRPAIALPAAIAAASLLLAVTMVPEAIPEQQLREELFNQNAMVNHPRTIMHQMVPVASTPIKGYVWTNDESNEMFILTEGLEKLAEKDYQVWFVAGHTRSNVGVLQWRGRMAHLYFHGMEMRRVENIAVSIEPKGGSLFPTGPDAIVVKIRHNPPQSPLSEQ
nr:anti-sigma factor [Brevibacillus sp. SYP-B805]